MKKNYVEAITVPFRDLTGRSKHFHVGLDFRAADLRRRDQRSAGNAE